MIQGYKRDPEAIKREGARGNRFHSFAPGRTILRILPPYSERGVWFKPILEYYIKNGDDVQVLVSPRDTHGRDPIAEYAEQLIASGDEKLAQRGKELRPRRRYLVNALVISDSKGVGLKDGVKIVGLPVKVKDDCVNFDTDVQSGFGDITNLERGFNIIVEKQGEGLKTQYSVRPMRDPSNILSTAKEQGLDASAWSLNNLDEHALPATEAELEAVVNRIKQSLAHASANEPVLGGSTTTNGTAPNVTFAGGEPRVGPPTGLNVPPPPGFER